MLYDIFGRVARLCKQTSTFRVNLTVETKCCVIFLELMQCMCKSKTLCVFESFLYCVYNVIAKIKTKLIASLSVYIEKKIWNRVDCRRSEKKEDLKKHTKGWIERFWTPNKTESNFSRESSSSKPRAIQKRTNSLASVNWVLPEGFVSETVTLCMRFWHTNPSGRTQLAEAKLPLCYLFVCLFLFVLFSFLYCSWLWRRGFPRKFVFGLVWLESVLLNIFLCFWCAYWSWLM